MVGFCQELRVGVQQRLVRKSRHSRTDPAATDCFVCRLHLAFTFTLKLSPLFWDEATFGSSFICGVMLTEEQAVWPEVGSVALLSFLILRPRLQRSERWPDGWSSQKMDACLYFHYFRNYCGSFGTARSHIFGIFLRVFPTFSSSHLYHGIILLHVWNAESENALLYAEFIHVSAMWISPSQIFCRIWNLTRKSACLRLSVVSCRDLLNTLFFSVVIRFGWRADNIKSFESGKEISPLQPASCCFLMLR